MSLTLTIENLTSLPLGHPARFIVPRYGQVVIGRSESCDWPLPDPRRFISGKHCEVRHHDDVYWLYDFSTNGTFVNGSKQRIVAPAPLSHGDRFAVGVYIIGVAFADEGAAKPMSASEKTVACVGKAFNNMFRQTVTSRAE